MKEKKCDNCANYARSHSRTNPDIVFWKCYLRYGRQVKPDDTCAGWMPKTDEEGVKR